MKRIALRLVLAGAFGVVGTGCVTGIHCETSASCPGNGVCDPGLKVCVTPEDGGATGGGMATGGGGAVGGGTGTGGAGGGTPGCASNCAAGQTCQPGQVDGTCRSAVIAIRAPMPDQEFLGGASLRVSASVTDWDGGQWPEATVPASVSAGTGPSGGVLVKEGAFFVGDVVLPQTEGVTTVVVGWEAVDASVTVVTRVPSCSAATVASCAEWQECVANVDGGACVSSGIQLSWIAPDAGSAFNGNSVTGVLRVQKADGGDVLPSPVPVRGPDGFAAAFGRTGSQAEGTLTLSGADGNKTFVAGWEGGGPTASIVLVRDTTPPTLNVTALGRAPDAGDPDPVVASAWKKDEKALVKVVVDDAAVVVSASNFTVPWGGSVASTTGSRCGCVGAGCGCFEVDLARTVVNGIRWTVSVSVGPVSDAVGNVSTQASASIDVTRFKWSRELTSNTATSMRPLALSASGVIFAGVVEGLGGRLFAFSPGGNNAWSAPYSAHITAGPVVSSTDVWIATLTPTPSAQFQPISISGSLGTADCGAFLGSYVGDLSLATVPLLVGDSGERPLGVLSGGYVKVADGSCTPAVLPTFGGPAHIVAQESDAGLNVFVGSDTGATVWKRLLVENQAWNPAGASSASPSVVPPKGLFLTGMFFGGGGGGVANGGVFSISASSPINGGFQEYAPMGAAQAGPVSVGNGYVVYGDDSGRLVRVEYSDAGVFGTATAVTVAANSSTQATNPVIGAGGRIYSLASNASNGTLAVSSASSDLSEHWHGALLFDTSRSLAQPALDVLRDSSGAKVCRGLGVLYISAAASSGAAKVTALLVDSEGLEPTAPWPKFQRDNANTGNISRSTAPWSCP
jgi:hypothetical protein